MPVETPRFIDSRNGKMFVLEQRPDGDPPKYWVIALNSGLQCRSGPRRLYVHLANRLVEAGLGVVRVDLSGVGDSDGPAPPTHFDMHDPEDVKTVIDHVTREYEPDGVLLQGLCAGSRVAIKAAAKDDRVKGLLAWSTTIFTATPGSTRPPEEPKHGVSNAVAEYNKGRMLRFFTELKFLRPSFWRDHLNTDQLLPELRSFFWSIWLLLGRRKSDDARGWFISSITSYVKSKRPVHFVYGELDYYCYLEFVDLDLDVDKADVLVVPGGTHTFSTLSQRTQVVDETCRWLEKQGFASSGTAKAA